MAYGKTLEPVMVCPFRFLERRQIFVDCVHLLKLHEPGNELRIIPELHVPGGSVDYCLVSVRDARPRDFVGIELQTIDTTGTVWPERQKFLIDHGVRAKLRESESEKSFGLNWKMTAKTTLMQLNHKIGTFEHLSKALVIVVQNRLLDYVRREFSFGHIRGVREGDPMQFHSYEIAKGGAGYTLRLEERVSTDAAGIAISLGLLSDPKVELTAILEQINEKLPRSILLGIGEGLVPISESVEAKIENEP
jgi:hypothetical protein